MRAKSGVGHPLLAEFLVASLGTLPSWEQGNAPDIDDRRPLLDDLQEFPDLGSRRVQIAEK